MNTATAFIVMRSRESGNRRSRRSSSFRKTFLAAVRAYDKFGGRSSVRSWFCGIVKHKIIDHYRKAGRETSFTDLEFLSDEF